MLENSRMHPLAEFTLSPYAPLRAVRSGKANGLPTLCRRGDRGLWSRGFHARHCTLVHTQTCLV
jgi:hypothetical protein